MPILTILGARPQFVKAAVVSKALHNLHIPEQIVHTGQHYDHAMSGIFWDQLGIPKPEINLEVGSGSHGKQTALMLEKIEKVLLQKPGIKALMVYGDTNSTLAGALAASKLSIPIIHVEAGLRSFNREMPEEINRVLTDHISDLLFCSSEVGVEQLKKEGIENGVFEVGDVMYDAFLQFSEVSKTYAHDSAILKQAEKDFNLITIHRPSNTDNDENLGQIISAFSEINQNFIWPVHPRVKNKLNEMELPQNIQTVDPQPYFTMLMLLERANIVFTDSGGLQKEAYWKKTPCITIREETEWVETLEGGWNQLTGPHKAQIQNASTKMPNTDWKPIYGEGKASKLIAQKIKEYYF